MSTLLSFAEQANLLTYFQTNPYGLELTKRTQTCKSQSTTKGILFIFYRPPNI